MILGYVMATDKKNEGIRYARIKSTIKIKNFSKHDDTLPIVYYSDMETANKEHSEYTIH